MLRVNYQRVPGPNMESEKRADLELDGGKVALRRPICFSLYPADGEMHSIVGYLDIAI